VERRSKREPKPSRKKHLGFPRDPRLSLLPSSSPTVNSFLLSFPTLTVFTLIRLVYLRRFYLHTVYCKILRYFYSSTRLSILSFYSRSPGLRSEQSIWTNGTMSTTSFVCIFSMKHQPFNSILFGCKCSNLICSSMVIYLFILRI
jgi:hypothetical protein